MRRIVLCLDGTWNSAFAEKKRRDGHTVLKPSNPLKLARAVKPFAADGTEQIVYYSIGVGSLSVYPGTANWLLHHVDRILGGAFGARFEANVGRRERGVRSLLLTFLFAAIIAAETKIFASPAKNGWFSYVSRPFRLQIRK